MLKSEILRSEIAEMFRAEFGGADTASMSGAATARRLAKFFARARAAAMFAHEAGVGGKAVCAARTYAVDFAVKKLFDDFAARRGGRSENLASSLCIIALGGYGRRELCPNSDVDILFLFNDGVTDTLKTTLVDAIVYPMWDAKLKLGHSSLSAAEALAVAKADFLMCNSMLDARFLCGSRTLFASFSRSFDSFVSRNRRTHFDGLMRLKRDRHAKCGWTPYLQEPDIKNGVGGLRDAQTMRWKSMLNFGGASIRPLAERGLISAAEYKGVLRAYDFLLRVRADMHFLASRENDLLDLETQSIVAKRLGFSGRGENARVENFMRRVYRAFRTVDSVSKTARKRMGLSLPDDVANSVRRAMVDISSDTRVTENGFLIKNGEISALRKSVFKTSSTRLISVFALCQKYGVVPSDALEVSIKDSRGLIDEALRDNPDAKSAFMSILQCRGNVYPALESMHFLGVLGAFVPEFRDITCMVQHEFYHRFTADIHILNSISELDKVFRARESDGDYWEYHKVAVDASSPLLLYLMLFLHDIGKGDGIRGHAEIGAEIGAKFLRRFGVPESDTESVLFVVRNHLQMARFWQSNDIEDETAIAKFASIVGESENLKYLYILTFCDAKATSADFWNSYKQSLHTSLYGATLAYFQNRRSDADMLRRRERVVGETLADPKSKGLEKCVSECVEILPQNYFSFHGRNDLLMHAEMLHRLHENLANGAPPELPVLEWIDDPDASITRLYVVSYDRAGLFATLSGVLTLSGLDILGSKILTGSDGITFDAFYVRGVADGISTNPRLRAHLASEIETAVDAGNQVTARVDEMFYGESDMRTGKVVDEIFMRREDGRLRVEIRARDRMGLLYRLAKTIDDCGYDIVFARINTELKWAHDTFAVVERPLSESPQRLFRELRDMC